MQSLVVKLLNNQVRLLYNVSFLTLPSAVRVYMITSVSHMGTARLEWKCELR